MSEPDLTVTILREIHDEIRGTNARLDDTNVRLDATRTELKAEMQAARVELKAELAAVEETLKDLAAQLLMPTRYVKNVVDRHEQAIDDLRERLVRLETRLERP